ncbi:MAG: prepilin-type N-terminal cleavage/methylation domain-containing protein [Okeania sp. SIO2C9]|uniref:prepilin-type N-terminal cleavage/methylation domain-containing protein n=1 Tax=Okeania sp. SIO2C9 TaxID=2607791 RepID=UPI0013C04C6C|nr:prepilin-type N-terminal cleavage/methylation domain-containing protein [Okeania sp. SIO2C9]NEQ77751.1 prepilin-type N-terminal cleavage/methylation domain-containing protein [Okeania sp. SIO2C9]
MNNLSRFFLQRLNNRKNTQGFTLIELLVVIIIIGILSSIGLVAFLNLVSKSKQVEAITYIEVVTDEQISNYTEYNQFKNNLNEFNSFPPKDKLNNNDFLLKILGFSHKTQNYFYGIPFINNEIAIQVALTKNPTTKSYAEIIYIKDSKLDRMKCEAYAQELLNNILPKLPSISSEDIQQELDQYCK